MKCSYNTHENPFILFQLKQHDNKNLEVRQACKHGISHTPTHKTIKRGKIIYSVSKYGQQQQTTNYFYVIYYQTCTKKSFFALFYSLNYYKHIQKHNDSLFSTLLYLAHSSRNMETYEKAV